MDIYERMAELKAELSFLDTHRNILDKEKEHLESLRQIKEEKEDILEKENNDVEKLEKTTISSLFYTLLGNKDEKIEKEKDEALRASVEYHRILNDYQIQQQYIERMVTRYQAEESIRKELEQLELDIYVIANPEKKNDLDQLYYKYEQYKKEIIEIDEAIVSGEVLETCLQEVLDYMKSAQGWGVYDMIGGGFISTSIKHSYIDKAQRAIQEMKFIVDRFEKELNDVSHLNIYIDSIDNGMIMMDYIFDNFFTDYLIQSKINENVKKIEKYKQRVLDILLQLEKRKENTYYKILRYNSQIKEIIST